jgi:hypothetical protein
MWAAIVGISEIITLLNAFAKLTSHSLSANFIL